MEQQSNTFKKIEQVATRGDSFYTKSKLEYKIIMVKEHSITDGYVGIIFERVTPKGTRKEKLAVMSKGEIKDTNSSYDILKLIQNKTGLWVN